MVLFPEFPFLLANYWCIKNTTDFWIFILYLATLLEFVYQSSSVLVESLGLSVYGVMSPENNDSFISSFSVQMFISSCLIAVARNYSTMSNKSGERTHPCLVLETKGKACSCHPHAFSPMFIAVLFTRVKVWKQPKSPISR